MRHWLRLLWYSRLCRHTLNISSWCILEASIITVSFIYSLLASEQEVLKEFIKKNLNMGFIWPISFLHSVPVLFVKKKNGSLCLYVNFCSLNHIFKKNCYPLLLIYNLLDSPCKAWVYSKIDLCHAYHLVYIANGDK